LAGRPASALAVVCAGTGAAAAVHPGLLARNVDVAFQAKDCRSSAAASDLDGHLAGFL